MKFTGVYGRQVSLSLALCVLVSACNKEEFFKAEEFLVGKDAYCFQEGPDLASCHALGDECRAAYLDAEDGSQQPEFYMCISNPHYVPPGSTAGAGSGDSETSAGSGSGDSETSAGSGSGDSETTAGSGSGSGSGSNSGSGSGSNSGSGSGNSDPEEDSDDVSVPPEPTIEEAYKSKCENLDAKYLWTKKEVTKKGTKTTKKVKICHQTGNNEAHTIVIACPALKAHIKHHDDYLGVCEE
ncbi:MAG: hypothetical protein H0V66_10060 [Bdellovibrionales bacterium]|nr:hypothetical protein [Bdellovibrionales bacterium]